MVSRELKRIVEQLNAKVEDFDALNVELKIEKEWRQKLQSDTVQEKEKGMAINMEIARYKLMAEVIIQLDQKMAK